MAEYDEGNDRITYTLPNGFEVSVPTGVNPDNSYSPDSSGTALTSPVYIPHQNRDITQVDFQMNQYLTDSSSGLAQVLSVTDLETDLVGDNYTYGVQRLGTDSSNYFCDGRGSVSEFGEERYRYEPYGEMTQGKPEEAIIYGYNAEAYNSVTDLQYLRYRHYDVGNGRFQN